MKFVVEAAPLLHFFLTVLHFYTRNACSFTRVECVSVEFVCRLVPAGMRCGTFPANTRLLCDICAASSTLDRRCKGVFFVFTGLAWGCADVSMV